MATNTTEILRKLQKAMPVADEEQRKRLEAGRAIQLQQAVQQAPALPTVTIPTTAQSLGTAQVQQAGAQQIQQAQQQAQQTAQMSQMALDEQKAQAKQAVEGQRLALGEKQIQTEAELSEQKRAVEDKILQNQLNFQRDEIGRAELQQSQLYDLAISTAKNEEDLKDRIQSINQASAERINYLEALANRLKVVASGEFKIKNQKLDQKSREYIMELQRQAKERAAKEKAKAGNRAAMFQAGGTIVGAVAGGVLGSVVVPGIGASAGATVGAAAGGALGSVVAAQTT